MGVAIAVIRFALGVRTNGDDQGCKNHQDLFRHQGFLSNL
jgi:hypothetical protein